MINTSALINDDLEVITNLVVKRKVSGEIQFKNLSKKDIYVGYIPKGKRKINWFLVIHKHSFIITDIGVSDDKCLDDLIYSQRML
jgi:hypothetical protein